MYFAAAIEQVGNLARARAVCRNVTFKLDKELIDFLGGEDIAEVYGDADLWHALGAAGSVLQGPEAVLQSFAGTGFRRLRAEAVAMAAGPMITSAWFAIQYPLIGGVLQAIPFTATFFGPPGWLVGVVTQSSLLLGGKAWSIGKIKYERKQEINFLKAALPALHSMAHCDGRFSVEELRLFKDVSGNNPHRSDFDVPEYLRELRSDAPHASIARISALPLSKSQKERLIELCVTMAHVDGNFDDYERDFVERLGHALGLAKQEFEDCIASMESRYLREQELAEAVIKGMCYLLRGKEVSLEEAVLLDMQLMNLVPAEAKREQICNEMMRGKRLNDLQLPDHNLALNAPEAPTGHYKSLVRYLKSKSWKRRTPLEEELESIARSVAGFVVALEVLEDPEGDPPKKNRQVRYDFETYMLHHGLSEKTIAKVLDDAVKMAIASRKQDEELERKLRESKCPQCGGSSFGLESKTAIPGIRGVYVCSACNSKLLRCRLAKKGCNNLILKGDVYDDEFCQEHNPFSLDTVKGLIPGQ